MMDFLGLLAAQKTLNRSSRPYSEDEFYKAYAEDAFPALTWITSVFRKLTLWELCEPPHKERISSHNTIKDDRLSEQASDVQDHKSEMSQPNRPESITP